MKLADIDRNTEPTFFRCMHDERPENPEVISLRRSWYARFKDKGLRTKVLLREDGRVVGLTQYLPVEHSPLTGRDLFVILCIAVHGYEHLVGNQQGKGYGRFMLDCIEQDARAAGAKGIAARADQLPDYPQWSSAPFFEHMGYSRVETRGPLVLMWKKFKRSARPPAMPVLVPLPLPDPEKVKVTVFTTGWCSVDCANCLSARSAVAGLENVDYQEIDTSDRANLLSHGIDDAVLLNNAPFREYGNPWKSEDLRAAILGHI
ncbi:MAG: GNAT family N-acetyltransferase [Candidatus Wallbacteria bacterium]|nr:GNAT family N-acetyltransferase [Candidatus Wallbacteria bacterium]